MFKPRKGYCFDDVLLVPKYSEIASRQNVDLGVDLGKGIKLKIPIIAANMKNISGVDMANLLTSLGGLPILHRFWDVNKEVAVWESCNEPEKVGASVGVTSGERWRAGALIKAGCKIICVDVAHGHHDNCLKMVKYISEDFPEVLLIAGNVATGSGARALADAGADVVKCGIGPSAVCTTRVETGVGVPQITALCDVFEASKEDKDLPSTEGRKFKIIADGGIKTAGDLVKSLCFSDAVMLGSLLAGTDEAPGNIQYLDGTPVKAYEGSSTHKSKNVEGVKRLVPLKGPAKVVIESLLDGVRSGCSYQGVDNLVDLKEDPEFVEMSQSGLAESKPHTYKK